MINYYNIARVDSAGITEPVDVEAIKSWLQIDFADFDTLLTGIGKSARQTIEEHCSAPLVKSDISFGVETTCYNEKIVLPYASGAISALVVKDADDVVVDSSLITNRGNILQISSTGYFTVTYTVTPTVLEALKEAIKMEAAERFAHRGENNKEYAAGISESAKAKAAPYKVIWL